MALSPTPVRALECFRATESVKSQGPFPVLKTGGSLEATVEVPLAFQDVPMVPLVMETGHKGIPSLFMLPGLLR